MALMGQSNVESTARPGKRNLPQTVWMNFLSFEFSSCAFDFSDAYCFLAPYTILADGYCLLFGRSCWNCLRALAT